MKLRHVPDDGLVSIYRVCHEIEADQAAKSWERDAAALVRALFGTACRIGELCGPGGLLLENCQPPMFRIIKGKTKASARLVKCMPEYQPYFKALVDLRANQGHSRLFPFSVRTGQRHFDYIMDKAG